MESELLELIRRDILDRPEPLTPETDLFAAGLDSMAIMQLLLAIEERWQISIDPADLSRENFATAPRIAALITQKQP